MIVRREADEVVIVRQADHARLSGEIAAAWGGNGWAKPERGDSVLFGATHHDDAWIGWDDAPDFKADGAPRSFFEVDRVTTSRLYGEGIDAVSSADRYAGLLVSLHYSGFFHGHWEWQPFSLPENFEEPERSALRRFVDGELERQRRLRDDLGIHGQPELELAASYRWLQLWDRISLDLCRQDPRSGWSTRYPPVPVDPHADRDWVELNISIPEVGVAVLDPWPLLDQPFHAEIPAVRVPAGDLRSVREDWPSIERVNLPITIRA